MERRVEDFIFRGTDEEAIVYIIDYYGEGIKRLIFTYVKNYAQTDDLFQDFLLKVYQNIGQFQGKSSLIIHVKIIYVRPSTVYFCRA